MSDLEHSVLTSLDASDPRLYPFLPELLTDLDDLGADPALIERLLVSTNTLPRQARVLDLGCGKGSATLHLLARHPWTALGLDGMPAFVTRARERAAALGISDRARFEVTDIRTWPGGEAFDAILLGAVGPVLGNTEATLRHVADWLTPLGVVVVDEAFHHEGKAGQDTPYHRSRQDLQAALDRAGFRVLAEAEESSGPNEEHQAMFEAIRRRAAALAQAHPEHRALFEGYVADQAREFAVLANDLVTTTLALGRA